MAKKNVPPSISEVSFDCPHCGAYTHHTWYDVWGEQRRKKDSRAPGTPPPDALEKLAKSSEIPPDRKDAVLEYYEKILAGLVVLDHRTEGSYIHTSVGDVHLSECFVCSKVAVWVKDRVVCPPSMQGPEANADLPPDVLADYNEAATIVTLSPRGAAALLRLSIQKLCKHLGEKGKKIDDDIASLVKKGLSPLVQKSLDAVRVIGNEAVHPGTLDLTDDVDTATKLFGLVNLIAEQMITNPNHVKTLYESLPAAKLEAIAKRDKS